MRIYQIIGSLLLLNSYAYGVHAHSIRYNNACLHTERRGDPDLIDLLIFKEKPLIPYNHVAATPHALVAVKKDVFIAWHSFALNAIEKRLHELTHEDDTKTFRSQISLIHDAIERLQNQHHYLKKVTYTDLEKKLIAVPEQDITLLMQWARGITIQGDDIVPIITITLDTDTQLVLGSCCGDLAYAISDHI
jgi:hypothetical protein